MALTVSVDEIVQGSRNRLLSVRPHWKRIRLGEIASVLNGFAFKSAQFTKGDGMPLIRIRDVGSDSTDTNYVGEFDERYIVEPGDLLVGMDGDFNCARWRGPRGLLNQRVCKVTLHREQYLPCFLDFALPGYLRAINNATSSVTVKHLSSRTIEDIPLPVPPLHEQEEIVAELEKQFSRLDEAVANLKRVKDRLDGYKGSIISEAVGGRATADDGVAPNGWRRDRLGDAAAKITSGSRDWSPYYGRGAAIFLLAQNVRPMSPDFSVVQRVDPPEADPARARSRVQRGDLLVTIVGANTGQACMVGELPGETFVCQSVALVRPMLAANAPYLNLWLNSPEHGRRYFDRCMYGQGRPHLDFDQLASMPIAIPPPDEQARIVAEVDRRLSIVREVDIEVDTNLKRARALRQAVLARAFSVGGEHA